MCHALYISSDKYLPFIEWDENNPGFWVGELQEHEQIVRKHFSAPFVVYAGSFEGCSCGFVYDDEPIEENDYEKNYDVQARESVRKLGDYISNALKGGSVELFACWEGEQDHVPDERLTIDLDFFERKEFGFDGTTYIRVLRK